MRLEQKGEGARWQVQTDRQTDRKACGEIIQKRAQSSARSYREGVGREHRVLEVEESSYALGSVIFPTFPKEHMTGQQRPGRTYWEVIRGSLMRPHLPLGFSTATVSTRLVLLLHSLTLYRTGGTFFKRQNM